VLTVLAHCTYFQANLAIQEARLSGAMGDLNSAQAQLDEKQRELDVVQAEYDQAMRDKQVCSTLSVKCRSCYGLITAKYRNCN
jgi:multidrug resistance efflux pump